MKLDIQFNLINIYKKKLNLTELDLIKAFDKTEDIKNVYIKIVEPCPLVRLLPKFIRKYIMETLLIGIRFPHVVDHIEHLLSDKNDDICLSMNQTKMFDNLKLSKN
jgi:hypothetical protein